MSERAKMPLALSGRRLELLASLLAEAGVGSEPATGIPRRENTEEFLLSSGQQRLWFLDRLENGIHYNDHFNLRLSGMVEVSVLERAISEILRRHEAMRAVFSEADGVPAQTIAPPRALTLPQIDLRKLPESSRTAELLRLAVEEARRPFDLSRGPLWRFTLLSLDRDDHLLLITAHHIAIDGWARGVFVRELAALYHAFSTGQPSPLAELPVQYADYAAWQAQWLESQTITGQLDYWKRQLAGAPGVLDLPADRPRPAVQKFQGARHWLTLSQAATASLKNLCQREGVTLFMALLAALQALLKRYTGQEDILVGTPVANRTRKESEDMIGYFLNTIVLRANLSGDPTFRELLRRARETVLGALGHQDLPLEKLIDALQPERNQSYTPLFQVLFVLQNTPMPDLELPGLVLRPFEIDNRTAKFDLTVSLAETPEGMAGWIEYATDLFDPDRIERLAGHFQRIVEQVSQNPEACLSQLSVLTPGERTQLLTEWNRTAAEYPRDLCIHELFEEQVRSDPDRIALEFQGERWTYGRLDSEASRIAAALRQRGVGPDTMVALCVERSPKMVAGVLGILKSGGAYVPLDPAYPKERLAFVLEDTRAKAVVTETALVELVRGLAAAAKADNLPHIICVDEIAGTPTTSETDGFTGVVARPDNLAYVIFTSGSTGKPKGVQIEHRSVVNFLESMRREPGLCAEDVLVAVTTLSFDIAGLELFLPLTTGARVVLASRETASDGPELARLLERSGATMLQATPATWRLLLEAGWTGHSNFRILCGGEAWDRELAERLLSRCGSLWNMYGPTETTIWSAASRVSAGHAVLIGGAIANTQFYIVDNSFQPVPVGVPGELCIGGDGVGRGYLNRPELTSEKFVGNPLSGVAGGRLYRTGDLARYRAQGTIEFLGRMDQQVKLRGFRVELGEVESVLGQHPQVRQAVVIVREDAPGDPLLVAYLIAADAGAPSAAELRDWLRSKLPEYMVPAIFVMLETLPLTPNGKVNRKALPAPSRSTAETKSGVVGPRDVLEQQLVRIWEKVLGVRQVGSRDSFFDLGGHSLTAVRLFAQVRKQTGQSLPLAILFQAPTVEQMAEILRNQGWTPQWSSLVPIQPGGRKPPFFCVHGGGGNVLLFRDLARHLGSEIPFYGLQSQGLDAVRGRLPTIEEMATQYLKEIRELQPEGPYHLGGFCMGGTVAYEIAQRLHAQDQDVRVLALFDTNNHNGTAPQMSFGNRVRYLAQKTRFHWTNVMQLSTRERWAYCAQKLIAARAREVDRISTKLANTWQVLIKSPDSASVGIFLEDVNEQAGYAYRPQVYPGKITLFRPRRNYSFLKDRQMGWAGYGAKGLEVVELPVDPGGMFMHPFVRDLAEKLRDCLEDDTRR